MKMGVCVHRNLLVYVSRPNDILSLPVWRLKIKRQGRNCDLPHAYNITLYGFTHLVSFLIRGEVMSEFGTVGLLGLLKP